MKKKPSIPNTRLFVRLIGRKHVFQMFLLDGCLMLFRAGDVNGGIDETLVQSADAPLRLPARGDIMLREEDAVRIRHVLKDGEKVIRIRMLHRFLEMQPFCCDRRLVHSLINDFAEHAHGAARSEKHTSKVYPLLRIANILLAISGLILYFRPAHGLVNIFLLPVLLALYCCFPGEMTLINTLKRRGRRYEYNPPVDISRQVCYGRVNITIALLFTALAACYDPSGYNTPDRYRLYLFEAVTVFILLAIVLLLTFDWRDQRSCIAVLLLALMIYSGGTTAALNRYLDDKPFATESAVVIDKSSTRSRKIVVRTDSGEDRYKLPLSQYQAVQPGNEVIICHHEGWLDIPYSTVLLP